MIRVLGPFPSSGIITTRQPILKFPRPSPLNHVLDKIKAKTLSSPIVPSLALFRSTSLACKQTKIPLKSPRVPHSHPRLLTSHSPTNSLAILGEASVLANAQVSALSLFFLLPRLVPAPQALIRTTRPERLEDSGYLSFGELLLCLDQDHDDFKVVFEDNFGHSATTARRSPTKGKLKGRFNGQVAVFVDAHDGQNPGHGRPGTNCGHLELGGFYHPKLGLPPGPPLSHRNGCLKKGGIIDQQGILGFDVSPPETPKWAIDPARNRHPKKSFCSTMSTASRMHGPSMELSLKLVSMTLLMSHTSSVVGMTPLCEATAKNSSTTQSLGENWKGYSGRCRQTLNRMTSPYIEVRGPTADKTVNHLSDRPHRCVRLPKPFSTVRPIKDLTEPRGKGRDHVSLILLVWDPRFAAVVLSSPYFRSANRDQAPGSFFRPLSSYVCMQFKE